MAHYYDSANRQATDPPVFYSDEVSPTDGDYVIDGGTGTVSTSDIDALIAADRWLTNNYGTAGQPGKGDVSDTLYNQVGLPTINISGISLAAGKTIWIKGGVYHTVLFDLTATPGEVGNKIKVRHYGEQFEAYEFGITNAQYIDWLGDISYLNLTGKKLGANHRSNYGVFCNNKWYHKGKYPLYVNGELTTDLTIDGFEIGNGGFAGIRIGQSAPSTPGIWNNVVFSNIYIHDTHSEGIYLGRGYLNSGTGDLYNLPRTEMLYTNMRFENITIARAGSESYQGSQFVGATFINCISFCSSAYRVDPWDINQQDGNIQLGPVAGSTIQDCIFHGGRSMFVITPVTIQEVEYLYSTYPNFNIDNCYFGGCKGQMGYFGSGGIIDQTHYNLTNCEFDQIDFRATEIFNTTITYGKEQNYYIGVANSNATYTVNGNKYHNSKLLASSSSFTNSGINESVASIDPPIFRTQDFQPSEYNNIEAYSKLIGEYMFYGGGLERTALSLEFYSDKIGDDRVYSNGDYVSFAVPGEGTRMYKNIWAGDPSLNKGVSPLDGDAALYWELCNFGFDGSLPSDDFVVVSGQVGKGVYDPESTYVQLPTHTGTTWDLDDLEYWRATNKYIVSGDAFADSPAAYTEIVSRADDLVNDINLDYAEGDVTSVVDVHTFGNGILAASFMYLITGDLTYGNKAKSKLIAQCSSVAVDWSTFAVGNTQGNNIHVGHWLTKLFNSFEYIKPLLSDSEITAIELWFDGGVNWCEVTVHTYLAQNLPNRLNRDYSVRTGTAWTGSTQLTNSANPNSGTGEAYAWVDDQGGFHNLMAEAHARYCNRTSGLMQPVGLWGIYKDDAVLIDRAKLYLEEWLKFGVYPDGSQSEWNRNGENDNGRAGLGTMYYGTINIECAMVLSDAMRRKGDNSWYEYTTSEGLDFSNVYGTYGSSGGNKNLKLVIDTYVECITQEVNRYWKEVLPANLIDPLQSNGTQYPFDLILGLANQYYRDTKLKQVYMRTYPNVTQYSEGTFSSAAGNAWISGGPVASFPAFNFMYNEREVFITQGRSRRVLI